MSGFDNGTCQNGIYFQVKQFGAILRGLGPPVPQAGLIGDLYIDTQTWYLYNKRAVDGGNVDPWGHYLFQVPAPYRTGLKWFSAIAPDDGVGMVGDYCMLWGGYANYGMQPLLYGPKQSTGWPENGIGGSLPILAPGNVLPVGLLDEGAALPESSSTQLIMTGLLDEVIAPVPVLDAAGDLVSQIGLASGPAPITVVTNPLYTAQDEHSV